MKLYPNLAGGLRFYFGVARTLVLVFSAGWILILVFGPLIEKAFVAQPKLMVSVGEVSVVSRTSPVTLISDALSPGSLLMNGVRGPFQADLLSKDPALVSALRWTVFPAIAVFASFTWLLFGALRSVCANIERHDVFSETNLRLVRRIGLVIIGYSVAGFLVQLFAAQVMNGYLNHHVTLTGLQIPAGPGSLRFSLLAGGVFPSELGIVTGFVVLMMTKAFRQGLALKSENDLTV